MQNKEFLGKEPIGRLLVKLAIPTVLAQLVNMLYNIVDRIYIGHIPDVGSFALTGVGVCMPVIMIVSAFAALVCFGGAPRSSIYLGENKKEEAERVLGNCFIMQIIISVIITVILLIWNEDLLMAFGGSENTIDYSTSYMNIYTLGTIFVQLTLGMNAFISAQGFTKISMISILIGAISNIILDPIFIYLFDLGVKGAALATIISQAVSCFFVLRFLIGNNAILKIKKEHLKLNIRVIYPCILLGLAPFIMQSSESIISICFNSSLQKYGGDIAVGAMTILTSVMQFAMLPLQGLAQGAQPITSYNYGARNIERVKLSFKLLLKVSLIYSSLLWLLVMIMPRVFTSIFTSDIILIEYAIKPLRTYLAALLIFGIQVACQMTFISLGNAKASIVVAVVRKFVLLLPLIYLMPTITTDKTYGIYLAEPIADVFAVTFTAVLFAIQFRKALKKIEILEINEKNISQ